MSAATFHARRASRRVFCPFLAHVQREMWPPAGQRMIELSRGMNRWAVRPVYRGEQMTTRATGCRGAQRPGVAYSALLIPLFLTLALSAGDWHCGGPVRHFLRSYYGH